MPQLVIDPNNRGNLAGVKTIVQLPPKVRGFAFVPDFEKCKAGDLILSSSIRPDLVEYQIVQTQLKAGFTSDDSRWTHAAVYLYEDFILEADPKMGVRSRSLYSDIRDSRFRVRRRSGLTDEERYRIALCAQRMLGMRYDLGAALSLGVKARVSEMWNRYWAPPMKTVAICSQVFYDAHTEITRHLLTGCPNNFVMPAHLSATVDLDDVYVPWLRLI
jgi:hypothetical protein